MRPYLVILAACWSSIAFSQDQCASCFAKLSTDADSPVTRFTQIAKSDVQQGLAPSTKAMWCLCKLALDLCGNCLTPDEREDMKDRVKTAEELLRTLGSSVPIDEVNEYKSHHKPVATSAQYSGGSAGNTSSRSSNSGSSGGTYSQSSSSQGDSKSESEASLDEKIAKLKAKNSMATSDVTYSQSSSSSDQTGKIKSESGSSLDEKIAQMKAKNNPVVIEKKQQAAAEKRVARDRVVALMQSADKNNCTESGAAFYLSNTPLSDDRNPNSLNGRVKWSVWRQIPGTALEIRFSKKSVCAEPQFPNTTDPNKNLQYVMEGADQFFDYGFLQLRNRSNQTVQGQLFLVTKGDEASHSEDWPFYLEPGKTTDESLGNWYMGCEIFSVAVKQYCKN